MNREEIESMPAGPQLNGLVATHVLKLKVQGNLVIFENGDYLYLVPDLGGSWMPSEDISLALEILDKLDTTFSLARAWKLNDPTWRGYSCWIGNGKDSESALGETMALAVCRALLLTFMAV